jgi:hypothetical protein
MSFWDRPAWQKGRQLGASLHHWCATQIKKVSKACLKCLVPLNINNPAHPKTCITNKYTEFKMDTLTIFSKCSTYQFTAGYQLKMVPLTIFSKCSTYQFTAGYQLPFVQSGPESYSSHLPLAFGLRLMLVPC